MANNRRQRARSSDGAASASMDEACNWQGINFQRTAAAVDRAQGTSTAAEGF